MHCQCVGNLYLGVGMSDEKVKPACLKGILFLWIRSLHLNKTNISID